MKSAFSIMLCTFGLLLSQVQTPVAAQSCTSCSLTISTAWATPVVAAPGVVVCITATGSVSGDILLSGGTVCNEGSISSVNILINSGSLTNYGSMDISNLAVTGGSFVNEGLASIDSLSQSGGLATVTNSDSLSGLAHSVFNNSFFQNDGDYGVINTSVFYGARFFNNGMVYNNNFSVFYNYDATHTSELINFATGNIFTDSLSVYQAIFENYGSTIIRYDFSMAGTANVNNFEYWRVGRDFSNDTSLLFTDCMIHVGRNWSNRGIMTGPSTGCGGFSVQGLTGNFGLFGAAGNLDMCDESNPGSFDLNTGSLGAGVTFCTCTDTCTYHVGIQETTPFIDGLASLRISPNPASGNIMIDFESTENTQALLLLTDLYGRRIAEFPLSVSTGSNTMSIETENYSPGLYIISITSSLMRIQSTFVKQ
jgi:hypothetical protein